MFSIYVSPSQLLYIHTPSPRIKLWGLVYDNQAFYHLATPQANLKYLTVFILCVLSFCLLCSAFVDRVLLCSLERAPASSHPAFLQMLGLQALVK